MKILEIDCLVKDFPGVRALDGISLAIEQGEIRGLIGPNGSGKTTFGGNILFKGEKVCGLNIWDRVNKGLNLTHQEALYVPGLSIYRHIELGIMINGYPRSEILEIADIVDLTDILAEDPSDCRPEL